MPTGEELLAELVAFSVPGAAGAISQGTVSPVKKGDSEVQKKLDIAKDEGSIDDAIYEQASYIASLTSSDVVIAFVVTSIGCAAAAARAGGEALPVVSNQIAYSAPSVL